MAWFGHCSHGLTSLKEPLSKYVSVYYKYSYYLLSSHRKILSLANGFYNFACLKFRVSTLIDLNITIVY